MHISELQGFRRGLGVRLGVLAVWNFAPTPLKAAKDVYVYNKNMAGSLPLLSRHLAEAGLERA